ncbi:MAG: hypothetical protein LBC79_06900 [Deltaproteobacteria bacterium]|nr:hypothetical protein [Deltaproteobacteria bacterium]
MTNASIHVRNMLRQYERQLLNARRLARYRMALRLAQGDAEPPEPKEVLRRRMVEKVAREMYEHLLFTGSENPVAESIRQDLSASAGARLHFQYTPGEAALQLVREGSLGPEEVSQHEKARLLEKLWHITLAKVDETML